MIKILVFTRPIRDVKSQEGGRLVKTVIVHLNTVDSH